MGSVRQDSWTGVTNSAVTIQFPATFETLALEYLRREGNVVRDDDPARITYRVA